MNIEWTIICVTIKYFVEAGRMERKKAVKRLSHRGTFFRVCRALSSYPVIKHWYQYILIIKLGCVWRRMFEICGNGAGEKHSLEASSKEPAWYQCRGHWRAKRKIVNEIGDRRKYFVHLLIIIRFRGFCGVSLTMYIRVWVRTENWWKIAFPLIEVNVWSVKLFGGVRGIFKRGKAINTRAENSVDPNTITAPSLRVNPFVSLFHAQCGRWRSNKQPRQRGEKKRNDEKLLKGRGDSTRRF